MGNLIIIPDENAFTLRLTGQIRTGDYTEDADFSVVTNLGVHFIRRGRIAQEFVLDEQGRIVIENEGNLARGVYGVELYGYYHGEKWRAFAKNVFAIVNNTEELLPVYDATIDASFGGDGVSAAYVEATLAAHNADQESHPDLREELGGKVSDVKVGDTSIVENGVATINPDSLGKVDDVQVNGVSVLEGKVAEIEVPTKMSDLQNDTNFADKAYVNGKVAAAGKVDDVQVNGVSVLEGKVAEIEMPTNVSELTNDSGYQTADDVALAIEDLQEGITVEGETLII